MRFSLGISTPRIRAMIGRGGKGGGDDSALALLVARVRANDAKHPLPLDDAAVAAKTFHGWPDFHGKRFARVVLAAWVYPCRVRRGSGLEFYLGQTDADSNPSSQRDFPTLLARGMECLLQFSGLATGLWTNLSIFEKFFLSAADR